jgi:hypothetical protein
MRGLSQARDLRPAAPSHLLQVEPHQPPAIPSQRAIVLLSQDLLHPPVNLSRSRPAKYTSSLAARNSRIWPKLNHSLVRTLIVNPQHAGSPLQAHLV